MPNTPEKNRPHKDLLSYHKKNAEQIGSDSLDTTARYIFETGTSSDGKSYKEQKVFVKDRPGHDRRYAINCDKIQQELGWKPAESFESGIRKTVQWYLDNSQWCNNITTKKYQRQRLGA